MKFKNNQDHDVYIDLGQLRRISPGEVVELRGLYKCPPLTTLGDIPSPVRSKAAPKRKKSRKTNTSGTI